jgi:hypothetical protein
MVRCDEREGRTGKTTNGKAEVDEDEEVRERFDVCLLLIDVVD